MRGSNANVWFELPPCPALAKILAGYHCNQWTGHMLEVTDLLDEEAFAVHRIGQSKIGPGTVGTHVHLSSGYGTPSSVSYVEPKEHNHVHSDFHPPAGHDQNAVPYS